MKPNLNPVMVWRIISILIFLLFLTPSADAQRKNTQWRENFLYEVKIINEFFERFDRDTTADFLSRFNGRSLPGRKNLIKMLFNRQQIWDTAQISSFITDITSSSHPKYLDFFDDHWYAVTNCTVLFQGKPKTLDLVLKVEEGVDHSSKWVIVSAIADFLNNQQHPAKTGIYSEIKYCGSDIRNVKNQTSVFLDPMSHGTNFMDLFDAFDDAANFKDYICEGPISDQLVKLIQLVNERKVKLKAIRHISYQLLQLPNWLLVIEYFNRETTNCGWLISNLLYVDDASKKRYEKLFLNTVPDE